MFHLSVFVSTRVAYINHADKAGLFTALGSESFKSCPESLLTTQSASVEKMLQGRENMLGIKIHSPKKWLKQRLLWCRWFYDGILKVLRSAKFTFQMFSAVTLYALISPYCSPPGRCLLKPTSFWWLALCDVTKGMMYLLGTKYPHPLSNLRKT